MKLLVSVRDAEEAGAALAGGADIIDAKEPALGPLAPVSSATLQSICAAVPPSIALSVALGDAHPAGLEEAVSAVVPLRRRQALFFKAAVLSPSPREATAALSATVRLLATRTDRPALIVARYVDAPADAGDLVDWVDACAGSGVRGLLLDTSRKTGGSLVASVGVEVLAGVRRRATRHGIWLALAGGVTIEAMDSLGEIRPHVIGVRGAACDGSRTGRLSPDRVEQLRQALDGVINRMQPQGSPA